MTAQLSFDDVPRARATDPHTSWEAACANAYGRSDDRRRTHEYLLAIAPNCASDFDLEQALGVKQTSIGQRRKELVDAGLVELARDGTGEPITRPVAIRLTCPVLAGRLMAPMWPEPIPKAPAPNMLYCAPCRG
jgi:hypothetical protein